MGKLEYQSEESVPKVLKEAPTNIAQVPDITDTLKNVVRKDDRPREKLKEGRYLSDAELLAIIISQGISGHNVLSIANAIMKDAKTLTNLTKKGVGELKEYKGIGDAKAIQIAAVLELAKRVRDEKIEKGAPSLLTHPEVVAEEVNAYKLNDDTESFFVLPIDKKCRLCGPVTEVTRGILDSSLVHPREVFRVALRWASASVIVAHNHPSGDPTPSREDLDVTRKLIEAGRIVAIPVTDHIIVGDKHLFPPGFHSIRRSGVIAFD